MSDKREKSGRSSSAVRPRDLKLLTDTVERERSTLMALFHVIQAVNSSLDLEEVLSLVIDYIIQLTQAERGFLMLLNQVGELEFKVARNVDQETIEGASFDISRTIVQGVVRQGRSVVTTNAQEDPRFSARESVVSFQLRSILCVPLRVKDQVTGVIYVDNRYKSGIFGDRHRDLLTAFANQAAVAIENARLFTETQRRAKQLAAALARQEELDRLKSEFIRNTSHELRTPLAIIQGYAELLEHGELGELSPEQRQPVSAITARARELNKLLDDFATILEVGEQDWPSEPVDLAVVVRVVAADYQADAQKAGLTLSTEIPPDLPLVQGNPSHLQRMVDNLLSNALKFTPSGGCVWLRLGVQGINVCLEVSDTGIGISPDQFERIFERFYQVDGSPTRRYGGTGLGLALVKEVVEAHGGWVTVESELGEGSLFRVLLPCVP